MKSSKFAHLLDKKKKSGEGLSDLEKNAKMSVLSDLHSKASKAMGSRLSSLKSSPSPIDKNADESHHELFGEGTGEEELEDEMPHSASDTAPHMGMSGPGDEDLSEEASEEGAEHHTGPGSHEMLAAHKPIEEMDEHELRAHIHHLHSKGLK